MSNISNERLRLKLSESKVRFYANSKTDGGHVAEEVSAMARELLAYRKASKEPVAWTDAEELRDVERGGCGYLFKANPITPHADERRVIKLYAAPPQAAHYDQHCTCPSGDGSLRWPCPVHPDAQAKGGEPKK